MLGCHLVFGAYGFWLPNDPRGSWSDYVGSRELIKCGRATKTNETESLAYRDHDVAGCLAAKQSLKRSPVEFTGLQARAIGRGFAEYARRCELSVLVCAILPDHVHLVLRAHRLAPSQLAIQLKGAATRQLVAERIHPFGGEVRHHKCFARGAWKVYIDTEDQLSQCVEYVNQNPLKEGLPPQRWNFVKS